MGGKGGVLTPFYLSGCSEITDERMHLGRKGLSSLDPNNNLLPKAMPDWKRLKVAKRLGKLEGNWITASTLRMSWIFLF